LLQAQYDTSPEKRLVGRPFHGFERGTAMFKKSARIAGVSGAGALAICAAIAGANLLGVAHADPVGPAACVTPDGSPCAPAPAGCVNPDNSLPCSSSLPDVNAAIRRELQQILPGLLGR